jgi:Serine aminopeptidase, S33
MAKDIRDYSHSLVCLIFSQVDFVARRHMLIHNIKGMLPSKYIFNNDDSSARKIHSSNAYHRSVGPSLSRPQAPPLGITGVLCNSQMIELPNDRGKLHCTIYRPRMMDQRVVSDTSSSRNTSRVILPQPNPPLICVAGGPGMPCQYLMALVHIVPDRAVVLYDHSGCGQSTSSSRSSRSSNSDPECDTASSSFLDDTVRDLAVIIETIVPMHTSFHLFGHSMGGIIAFEYIKRGISNNGCRRRCQALILASTPTNIHESHQTKRQLIQEIALKIQQSGKSDHGSMKRKEDDDDDDNSSGHCSLENDEQQLQRAAHLEFLRRHKCRVTPIPLPLQQSLTGLHRSSRQVMGTLPRRSSLESYVVTPILSVEGTVKDSDDVVQTDSTLSSTFGCA